MWKSIFSKQFRKLINRYKRIGYNIDVMRQTACLVINPITVDSYAFFFNCTAAVRASLNYGLQVHKAFLSGLEFDATSWAWHAVVQPVVSLSSGWQCL